MKLFFDLSRNPIIHSHACDQIVSAKSANDLVDRYRHHFSAEYELYQGKWRARLTVKFFRQHILRGEQLEAAAEALMDEAVGMHPAHSAYALGGVRVGKEMYKFVKENGKPFSPRVFMMRTDHIKANPDLNKLGNPIRHLNIGQHDYRRAVELDGETSGRPNGGYFAQMINPQGTKSKDGARVGLVMGYRPRYQIDHVNMVARIIDSRDINRCHVTIIYGRDFDTLMRIVDLGGEAVKPLFFGDAAYFGTGAEEVAATEGDLSVAEERELVRGMLTPKPVTQSMSDKLKDVAIEPSASAAAPTDDSASTSENAEEHISDSDSDSLATSDGDEASEDAGSESNSSSTSDDATASASEPQFRTAAQQRMFEADAAKKRAADSQQPANDTAASV